MNPKSGVLYGQGDVRSVLVELKHWSICYDIKIQNKHSRHIRRSKVLSPCSVITAQATMCSFVLRKIHSNRLSSHNLDDIRNNNYVIFFQVRKLSNYNFCR